MNENTIKNIYILNLEKKKERWNKITTRLNEEKNNTPYYQFCGVDGSKMNIKDINNDIHFASRKFLMTKEMYGKAKSHISLWKHILKENNNLETKKEEEEKGENKETKKEEETNNNNNNEWFLILEDDCVIPPNFNDYILQLTEFLNDIPEDIVNSTDMFNLSSTGDYKKTNKSFHNKILSILTMIATMILKKHKSSNNELFTKLIKDKNWSLIDSNFPLSTHAYLVNKKQLENLVDTFEKSKIYYHLDWQLNLENLNINTILPIGIRRGGFDDSTTSAKTAPSILVKILTMFNKELACDLGKPVCHILGLIEINVLIIIYGLLILLWNIIDIPGRLNDYFLSVN